MPLRYEHYADGIFICGLEERVNEDDARQWAKLSKRYAYTELYPIVAILDVNEANYITAMARQILSRAADNHYLHAVAVVTSDFIVEQNMRLTALMCVSKNIEVFDSLESAQEYADNHARLIKNIRGEMPHAFSNTNDRH